MPYKSEAQRRAMHAKAERGEISDSTIEEFDEASKGKKLPERAGKKGDLHAWAKRKTGR